MSRNFLDPKKESGIERDLTFFTLPTLRLYGVYCQGGSTLVIEVRMISKNPLELTIRRSIYQNQTDLVRTPDSPEE